ncbi:MAG TPA: hypothetical protein VFZ94_14640 [Burkholderiales bacterium]
MLGLGKDVPIAMGNDDPKLGWKGRGIWTTSGCTNFHLEGGKEQKPKAVKLQLRPDPLAR